LKLNRSAAISIFVLCAAFSAAKPPFLKVLLATYKVSPTSELGKSKCLACHQSPAPPNRNPYGLAVQKAMAAAHSRMVTAEILKSVEKLDSDGDGAANIEEIKANTLPGDPKSKPKKKHASLPGNASDALIFLLIPSLAMVSRRKRLSDPSPEL